MTFELKLIFYRREGVFIKWVSSGCVSNTTLAYTRLNKLLIFDLQSHEFNMLRHNILNLIQESVSYTSRSQWPCDTRCGSGAAWLLGLLRSSSVVFVVCCVGSGLCGGLITRSEELHHVCVCVCVCVWVSNCVWSRNQNNEATYGQFGLQSHRKKKIDLMCFVGSVFCEWTRQKVLSVRQLDGQFRVKMDVQQDVNERNILDCLILYPPEGIPTLT
jgi:hypothetical protein